MFFFSLPKASIFEVTGKDSTRYLHARLSNDIRGLEKSAACWAAALTPQGRTQAFFSVLNLAPWVYLLSSAQGENQPVVSALKQYIVADRVEVKDLSSSHTLLHLAGEINQFENLASKAGNYFNSCSDILSLLQTQKTLGLQTSDCILVGQQRTPFRGIDVTILQEKLPHFIEFLRQNSIEELAPELQEVYRIQAGLPAFERELNEHTLFSECGFSPALSFTKGCYVGQEVIEKVDARGKVPRILKRFKIAALPELAPGTSVHLMNNTSSDDTVEIGKVTSFAYNKNKAETLCFAYCKNIEQLSSNLFQIAGCQAEVF